MLIAYIKGANRVCGKSQGFLGLPIRDTTIKANDGTVYNVMNTAWTPTPDELLILNAGGNVVIAQIGTTPLPMAVGVSAPPIVDTTADAATNKE